jgi:hypothetical protein
LGLRSGGEGGHLFVADVNPAKLAISSDGVADRVQTVADDAVDVLYSGANGRFDQRIGYREAHHIPFRAFEEASLGLLSSNTYLLRTVEVDAQLVNESTVNSSVRCAAVTRARTHEEKRGFDMAVSSPTFAGGRGSSRARVGKGRMSDAAVNTAREGLQSNAIGQGLSERTRVKPHSDRVPGSRRLVSTHHDYGMLIDDGSSKGLSAYLNLFCRSIIRRHPRCEGTLQRTELSVLVRESGTEQATLKLELARGSPPQGHVGENHLS